MPSEEAVAQARERAIPVLDAWMAGFNVLDLQAWKATMHFPHFRLASGIMHRWEDADMDDAFIARVRTNLGNIGWHYSVGPGARSSIVRMRKFTLIRNLPATAKTVR